MQDKQKQNLFSPRLIAAVAITVVMGGTVTAWLASQFLKSSPQDRFNLFPTKIKTSENPDVNFAQTEKLEVYWLDDNLELTATSITIQKTNNQETSLENLLKILLSGNPQENNNGTTIPEGTKILGLKLEKDGIHLNLSQEFVSGGGSASMIGRLGQIIYTATSIDSDAQVWINVNGKPLQELGGEGLLVEQPMTREMYQEYFSVQN